MTEQEPLMTTKQAAAMLGCSTKTVIRAAARKKVALKRFKREYRLTREQAMSLADDVVPAPSKPADTLGDASESPPSSR